MPIAAWAPVALYEAKGYYLTLPYLTISTFMTVCRFIHLSDSIRIGLPLPKASIVPTFDFNPFTGQKLELFPGLSLSVSQPLAGS